MSDKPIDIMQDFIAQYAKEEMLAFFDFTLPQAGRAPVAGLCKISQPKNGARLKYLSLTFMVDTPDEEARVRIERALNRMEEDGLRKSLPAVAEVIPMPSMNTGAENYIRQTDILLQDVIYPDRSFVADLLIPAIRKVTGVDVTDVVWWDGASTPPAVAGAARDASLVSSVREYLKSWGAGKK